MSWKKSLIVCSVAIFALQGAIAQSNLLNAKQPEQIGVKTLEQQIADNDKPLEYGYIDDKDIVWSKVTWEYIDLNEKLNLPLYYPLDSTQASGDRRSLFDTMLRGIKQGKITEVYTDSYFTEKLEYDEIQAKAARVDTTDYYWDLINQGETNPDILQEGIDYYDLTSQDIQGFKIKGLWYFDKKQGEMKYRLIGVAPIAPDVQTLGRDDLEVDVNEKLALFWVFYPNTRDVMHEMKVFNQKNSAYPISFDHLLNARRFSSVIIREENQYGDRMVEDYVRGNALFQVMESEKIKENIRDKEQDFWNY